MVNKCSGLGYLENQANFEMGTVFELPKDKDHQIKWLSFLDRNDIETKKHVFAFINTLLFIL